MKNKRKTSIELQISPIKEAVEKISINDNKFECKTSAAFSCSKPTKSGVLKQYVSTNLMLFQDESYNAKRDEYKDSLNLVKRDLERRKK